MGEMAAAVPALNVSVSFGKFEKDSLSWEKWSSFSPNKYLEEVEKCATPGSVAQKKSYFEAHYKKIAARKARLTDQEKRVEDDSLRSNDRNEEDTRSKQDNEDAGSKICETDSKGDLYSGQHSIDEVTQEAKLDGELDSHVGHLDEDAAEQTEGQVSLVTRVEEEQSSNSGCLMLKEPQDVVSTREEERSSSNMNEELNSELGSPMFIKTKETAILKEVETETPPMLSRGKDSMKKVEKEMERIPISQEENVKLDQRKEPPKKSMINKVRDVARTRKPISPVTKASQASTPKVRNPVPTSTSLSASWSSTKKVTGSLSLKGKNPPAEDSKRVAPKSLHMSLSMEPPSPSPASPAPSASTRKSLIMEKMGDKDIVKRAFKTFQNNYNQLKASSEERYLRAKQVPTKGTETKVPSTASPRRVNGGSSKLDGVDRKTAKPALSYFGLKNDERAKKKEEFSKKPGEKSSAKDTRSVNLQTKSKEQKVAEIEKQRHSLNFKAMPMPGFYRAQRATRGPLDKEGSKTLQI